MMLRAPSRSWLSLASGLVVMATFGVNGERAHAAGLPSAPGANPEQATPPSLKEHPEAPYPREALEQRVEGNVGLELDLDVGGNVVGVRVTVPAGHTIRKDYAMGPGSGWN